MLLLLKGIRAGYSVAYTDGLHTTVRQADTCRVGPRHPQAETRCGKGGTREEEENRATMQPDGHQRAFAPHEHLDEYAGGAAPLVCTDETGATRKKAPLALDPSPPFPRHPTDCTDALGQGHVASEAATYHTVDKGAPKTNTPPPVHTWAPSDLALLGGISRQGVRRCRMSSPHDRIRLRVAPHAPQAPCSSNAQRPVFLTLRHAGGDRRGDIRVCVQERAVGEEARVARAGLKRSRTASHAISPFGRSIFLPASTSFHLPHPRQMVITITAGKTRNRQPGPNFTDDHFASGGTSPERSFGRPLARRLLPPHHKVGLGGYVQADIAGIHISVSTPVDMVGRCWSISVYLSLPLAMSVDRGSLRQSDPKNTSFETDDNFLAYTAAGTYWRLGSGRRWVGQPALCCCIVGLASIAIKCTMIVGVTEKLSGSAGTHDLQG
ncbi:hypothetical protein C8R43DRAFT_950114 [Mycena crocata]|nr:hypothetical protein C8R43DRAFT_950114 [Mycena crocata]